jgi:tetratricopeptide (TPR) repeat protein
MDPRIANAARFQQQKNYPAAEQIYRRILSVEPKNVDGLLLLGLLLHETSRHEESVTMLRRALAVQPHRAEVRQTLVGPLMALGRLGEAIVEARELVRLQIRITQQPSFRCRQKIRRVRFLMQNAPSSCSPNWWRR